MDRKIESFIEGNMPIEYFPGWEVLKQIMQSQPIKSHKNLQGTIEREWVCERDREKGIGAREGRSIRRRVRQKIWEERRR